LSKNNKYFTAIASCHHEIVDWPEGEYTIYIKDYTREFRRCLCYLTVCKECYDAYKKADHILETEQEKRDWLDGISKDFYNYNNGEYEDDEEDECSIL
jgi:hypothetical protein